MKKKITTVHDELLREAFDAPEGTPIVIECWAGNGIMVNGKFELTRDDDDGRDSKMIISKDSVKYSKVCTVDPFNFGRLSAGDKVDISTDVEMPIAELHRIITAAELLKENEARTLQSLALIFNINRKSEV